MDGLTLLKEARVAGLVVIAEGDRLRIRGPRKAEPIVRQLIAYKDDVLRVLTMESESWMCAKALSAEWHLVWDERAAIMEYDGGLPRERAEALALNFILEEMRQCGC